jgi:hypothetical protein
MEHLKISVGYANPAIPDLALTWPAKEWANAPISTTQERRISPNNTMAVLDHQRGLHDEGGRIIHETPKEMRSQFAREIWRRRSGGKYDDVPF